MSRRRSYTAPTLFSVGAPIAPVYPIPILHSHNPRRYTQPRPRIIQQLQLPAAPFPPINMAHVMPTHYIDPHLPLVTPAIEVTLPERAVYVPHTPAAPLHLWNASPPLPPANGDLSSQVSELNCTSVKQNPLYNPAIEAAPFVPPMEITISVKLSTRIPKPKNRSTSLHTPNDLNRQVSCPLLSPKIHNMKRLETSNSEDSDESPLSYYTTPTELIFSESEAQRKPNKKGNIRREFKRMVGRLKKKNSVSLKKDYYTGNPTGNPTGIPDYDSVAGISMGCLI